MAPKKDRRIKQAVSSFLSVANYEKVRRINSFRGDYVRRQDNILAAICNYRKENGRHSTVFQNSSRIINIRAGQQSAIIIMTVNDAGKRYAAPLPLCNFPVQHFNIRNYLFGVAAVIEAKIDNRAVLKRNTAALRHPCGNVGAVLGKDTACTVIGFYDRSHAAKQAFLRICFLEFVIATGWQCTPSGNTVCSAMDLIVCVRNTSHGIPEVFAVFGGSDEVLKVFISHSSLASVTHRAFVQSQHIEILASANLLEVIDLTVQALDVVCLCPYGCGCCSSGRCRYGLYVFARLHFNLYVLRRILCPAFQPSEYCDNPNCKAERNNRKARVYYKRKKAEVD